jgi:predicted ArsR family transcriptional regulator
MGDRDPGTDDNTTGDAEHPATTATFAQLQRIDTGLERDVFVRTLIRHLAGTLQDVVGLKEASGFVSVVGQQIGEEMNAGYKRALRVDRLSKEQVAAVCLDLKKRIKGDFYIVEQDDEKIVFGNRTCPFAEKVIGRPALCMMTSNVFGHIAADNVGYSKVSLERTIADGHPQCRVVVYLTQSDAARDAEGREYSRGERVSRDD